MTRIYVSNGCAKLYKDIANALDASYIDYDMDGYDRYMPYNGVSFFKIASGNSR